MMTGLFFFTIRNIFLHTRGDLPSCIIFNFLNFLLARNLHLFHAANRPPERYNKRYRKMTGNRKDVWLYRDFGWLNSTVACAAEHRASAIGGIEAIVAEPASVAFAARSVISKTNLQ
jgi:hypothetical protein